MTEMVHPLRRHMRPQVKRTTNCPGCGNGIVTQAILRAIDELGLDMNDFVFVAGIGCSAWIPSPLFEADCLHTTHGRPIAYATGVKAALPHKKVCVVSGDGDLSAIGGNHLIHAARKNVDLTVVLVNNGIYGMTGGQTAPTSPHGLRTITSPYGNVEHAFDLASLIVAAGASYVARWTTYHPRQMSKAVVKGLEKEGFAFIEAVSQCPVQYGRASKLGKSRDILAYYKEQSVKIEKAASMTSDELEGKIIVGDFVDRDKAELVRSMVFVSKQASGSEA